MADLDNRTVRATAGAGAVDAGLRRYMQQVYEFMFLGLAITGLVAYGTFLLSVTTDPSQSVTHIGNLMLTQFGATMFLSPLRWVVIFSPLVLVLLLQNRIPHISATAAQLGFFAYAAVLGASLSVIFVAYTMTSIEMVFFVSAAMFGGMSLYGYTTKSDLSGWGSFLIMGVLGVVIASVINVFLQSSMLSFVFSCIGVVVFTGITAYHTQQIKEMYDANDDGTVSSRKAIYGALALYITFINLFLSLLRLFGSRR